MKFLENKIGDMHVKEFSSIFCWSLFSWVTVFLGELRRSDFGKQVGEGSQEN